MARPDDATADAPAPPSKTRLKKAMHDLQALGEQLLGLDRSRLAELDLPERLVDAIELARTTTKHEARRRQIQYIGRLMRDIDPAPIAAALDRWTQGSRAQKALFATVERWRDRLLTEDGALEALLVRFPAADRLRVAGLVQAAQRERAAGAPPKHSRELFRHLKSLVDDEAAAAPHATPDA